ncbi:GNAT family N-acetyltransferase [Aestuariibaculum lutulentum]|uniref:GNAT family N-acetyltransferase n=1 Tax=Aestuariibaculum lutulentum TaxID=2920935 RepID=A0ABS9RI76_9FLAO|nr:GNAT family N-acetyltransferase [Aestuariibaculum lutulentum]MCH4552647.1 GNAT family N-acetyltransferase [Aestuariibaculum lutulentum]
MITIKEVKTKKDLKDFVKFPFKLYKGSKYWVPPIISEEAKTFDVNENPVFNDAEATLFLAYKNNEIVGRVSAMINWLEVNGQDVKKMRFGWFDFIDDLEVSKALLNKVEEIGRSHGLEYAEGPVGFSNLDKVGVMYDGFENRATMVTWYNHPYYIKHYEALGYNIEKSYSESSFSFDVVDPKVFLKLNDIVTRRYQLKALNFTKTSEVMPYVDRMFDLFNDTYAKLSSFVAVTDIQKEYFKKKFIGFVNPEYIKFVVDKDDNLIAFAVVLPSFAEALQKAKGKLFPFGFAHILRAKKNSKNAIFYLIGVHPDYQHKGVHALIFNEFYETFKEKGVETCVRTPELDDNIAIRQIWKHFDSKVYARRRTYKKNL